MDVNLTNNIPYSIPRSVDFPEINGKAVSADKPETPSSFEKRDSISKEVRDQVMMNQAELQNFLYMLIGSKIRVDSGRHSVGSSVNTAA